MPARDPGELVQELRAFTPGTGKVLTWDSAGRPMWATPTTGVTDHGALTGLGDDDHTQYQLKSEKGAANGYASLGPGGLVPVAQLGSGTPDGTKFLRDDGTFQVPPGGGAGQLALTFHADAGANATLTNQANAEQFLVNSNRNIVKADLTNYTQVRLVARVVTASASANNPRLYVEYSPTFTTTVGSFLDIGASAVSCSLAAAGLVDSGWINLVAGAKADVFVAVLMNGGNAAADPALGPVIVQFR